MRALFLILAMTTAAAGGAPSGDHREKSRELIKTFASELKGELTHALAEGGPTGAIHVCRDVAPAIAARLSRKAGASIGRTSLRFRNPANLPEPWQRPQLERFDDLDADAGAGKLEAYEEAPAPGIAARYMKAIPTEPACLACHGEPAGEVREALAEAYPHDRATGYEAGDIRGAFYVVWPDASKGRDSD